MKKLILLLAVGIGLMAFTQTEHKKEDLSLTVVIENIKKQKGVVGIRLCDENQKTKSSAEIDANGKSVRYTFKNLKPGKYAVQVLHDANENGKLDMNFFGIPTEAYGFSNNARGSFGPPDIKEQLFDLKESKTISIKID